MRIARTLDLAGEGLLVEALGVAVLDNVERGVGKHLNEGDAGIGVKLASGIAVSAEGRDERGDRNVAGISKELGHLEKVACQWGRAGGGRKRTSEMRRMFSWRSASEKPRFLLRPKRMLSPSRRYAWIPKQARLVRAKAGGAVGRTALEEDLLESRGHRRLARGGQASEPDGHALLTHI